VYLTIYWVQPFSGCYNRLDIEEYTLFSALYFDGLLGENFGSYWGRFCIG